MLFHTILRMLSVGWIILIATSAMAQDKEFKIKGRYQSPSGCKKWAVIICINDYLNTNITDLRFTINDAEKLHQLIVDPEHGGFRPNRVKLITSKKQIIPNRINNVLKALRTLENNADAEDTIFYIPMGSGIEEYGKSYFLSNDTATHIVSQTAMAKSDFEHTMNRTKARIQTQHQQGQKVENDEAKTQAKVNLDTTCRCTKTEQVLIEDMGQGKTFGYPLNLGYRNSVLWRSALVPGYGQLHVKNVGSGFLFLSSSIIAGAVTLAQYAKTVATFRRYEGFVADYESAITKTEFQQINRNLKLTKKRWRIKRRQYYSALAIVGGIWSLNMLDAATTTPPSKSSFSSSQNPDGNSLSPLSLQFWPSVWTINLRTFF